MVIPAPLLWLLKAAQTRETRRFVLGLIVPREEDLETKVETSGQNSDDSETQNANEECNSGRDDTSECSNNSKDVYGIMSVVQPYKKQKLTGPKHALVKGVTMWFRTIDSKGDEGDNE